MTEPDRSRSRAGVSNVLWLTERFPPLPGGMAESAGRHVTGLRRTGTDLDVILLRQGEGATAVGVKQRDGGTDFRVDYAGSAGNAAQRAWALARERHRRQPYDVVVGFGANMPGHVATTFAAWLGLPSVVLVRGNDFDRDWFEPRRTELVAQALSRATAVGTVTREKARKIQALFPGTAVQWTPNGIDVAAWQLLPAEREASAAFRADLGAGDRRVIGLFGELKYKKRVPLWLGALRDAGLRDSVVLLVVGRMDEETDQLLADPALSPPCTHLSFRARSELPALYHVCDYTVIPSLFEGFPNVLIEAMACGVVPIVSDAGAMADVVKHGETGFVFPVEDRAGAARATSEALGLSDDELATAKGRAREAVTTEFSLRCEIEALQSLIDRARDRYAAKPVLGDGKRSPTAQ